MSLEQAAAEIEAKRGRTLKDHVEAYNEKAFARTGLLIGLRSKFRELDIALEGLQDGFYMVAGRSHHGKTMKMLNYAFSIAENNKGHHVVFCSIDDRADRITNRLLAMFSGYPMSHIAHPNRFLSSKDVPESTKNHFKAQHSYATQFLSQKGNFELCDIEDGRTLELIFERCEQRKSEGKKVVLFIDNFHNLKYTGKSRNENEKWQEVSFALKEYSKHMPVVCTVKLRKASSDYKGLYRRPHIDEIKNAVDLQFDADVIMSIYSHFIASDKKSELTIKQGNVICPVIETKVLKNKYGECHQNIYDVLYGYKAWMEECDGSRFEEFKSYIDNWKEG